MHGKRLGNWRSRIIAIVTTLSNGNRYSTRSGNLQRTIGYRGGARHRNGYRQARAGGSTNRNIAIPIGTIGYGLHTNRLIAFGYGKSLAYGSGGGQVIFIAGLTGDDRHLTCSFQPHCCTHHFGGAANGQYRR